MLHAKSIVMQIQWDPPLVDTNATLLYIILLSRRVYRVDGRSLPTRLLRILRISDATQGEQ